MKLRDVEALASQMGPVVRAYIARLLEPLFARIAAIEARTPERGEKGDPGERGDAGAPGEQGPAGRDGRDADPITREMILAAIAADPTVMREALAAYLEANPPPAGRDGVDGKDGASGAAGPAGEVGPRGEKGDPGDRGEPGAPGQDGARGAQGEKGDPGADGVGLAGALISRDGELVLTLTNGLPANLGPIVGRDGAPGPQGHPGEPGAVGPKGDPGEAGPQGERGADGLGFDEFEPVLDGRTVTWRGVRGGEVVKEYGPYRLGTPVYRDIYKAGEAYEAGDMVTWGGSTWIAMRDTREKPGENGDWRLMVKKGRDGRDGKDGKDGERGPPGKDGKSWSG